METLKGFLSVVLLVCILGLPQYFTKREFKRKVSEDYDIDYEGTDLDCAPPFEKNGNQFFKILCKAYQHNKINYIENILCKTGNDIIYGEVKYVVLGCFREKNEGLDAVFSVMVKPDIEASKISNVNYNLSNNISGVMNGDFIVNIGDKEIVQLLLNEIRNFHSLVSDNSLKKDLELFDCKLQLANIKKEEAHKFLELLKKYKDIPAYASSIAAVTNAVFNCLKIFK